MTSKTTRRIVIAALAAGASLGAAPALAQQRRGPRDVPQPKRRMGINLAGLNYWNTELPFVDLMRMSGDWQLWRADTRAAVRDAKPEGDARGWLRTPSS